jgi:hypothetical protein
MSIESSATTRQELNVDVIRTMLDPLSGSTAPANNDGGASGFLNAVQFECTFVVAPAPVPFPGLFEAVPFDTGMILWLPQDGVDSLYHMGFVPAGSFIDQPIGAGANAAFKGITMVGNFRGPASVLAPFAAADLNANGWHIINESTYCVPRTGANQAISLSPQLDINFSRTKLVSGRVEIKSDTIPIGATALAGYMSAGVLMDTRDIALNGTGAGATCYSVTDLVTASVTVKDGIKLEPIANGITSIAGPDLCNKYTAPRQILTDTLNAEFFEIPASNPINFVASQNSVGAIPLATEGYLPLFQMFVTPVAKDFWVQTQSVASNVRPAEYTRVQTNPIAETGVLDVEVGVNLEIQLNAPADWSTNNVAEILINAIHFFERVDNTGACQYSIFSECISQKRYVSERKTVPQMYTAHLQVAEMCKFQPRKFRTSFVNDGKYVGTHVFASVGWAYIGAGVGNVFTGNVTYWQTAPTVIVTARNDDKEGRVGVAHIIRYDNVAAGQNLTIRGQAQVMCVAQGNLAPFVHKSISATSVAADTDVMNYATMLWNGDSPYFRRNYPSNYYNDEILRIVVPNLSPQWLDSYGSKGAQGQEIRAAGASAGLFGILRQALPLAMDLGEKAFGDSAGGFAERGQSRGQFNQAAGMFGGRSAGQIRARGDY